MTRSRAIERLARRMSKRQDNPGPIENTGNEKNPEWTLDGFKQIIHLVLLIITIPKECILVY